MEQNHAGLLIVSYQKKIIAANFHILFLAPFHSILGCDLSSLQDNAIGIRGGADRLAFWIL